MWPPSGGRAEPPAAAPTQRLHLSLRSVQGVHRIHDGAGDVPEGDAAVGGCTAQEVPPGREVLGEPPATALRQAAPRVPTEMWGSTRTAPAD